MNAEPQSAQPRRPKIRWLILIAAAAFAACACAAMVVVVLFYRSNMPLVVGAATVAGISIEVLFWTAAGVFGWSFLDKRREALGRWKRRLFGGRSEQ